MHIHINMKPRERNLRTDSLAAEKDKEAGLPQSSMLSSLHSDSICLTSRGGDLHVNEISHPYTVQSANKSVKGFSHLIDHLNQADCQSQGSLLNTLSNP